MGPSTRPWILALFLVACRRDSDSSGLVVQSISVPDFGLWESNRPIEFAFNQRIDFASVSGQSIRIRTSLGAPAAGTFAAKTIDADGDGAPEGADESVVVFYPRCPTSEDLSDAGLTLGARYLVTLAGTDSGQDPAALLRSRSGGALARTVVHAFETIADPDGTLQDEMPGSPPLPLLRAAGASSGPGCHLELGGDPSNQVFFETGPAFGRPPGGFTAPLNLFGDPATHVAFVVVFDQPIRSTPENLARLSLEYSPMLTHSAWRPLETRVELVSNCRPLDVAVRLVPLGTFPPGGFVRVRIDAGFQDIVGEETPGPLDELGIIEVATVAFTSLDPAGAIADEIREEFDFGAGSPLSLADPVAPPDAAPAEWGGGELRANPEIVRLPPELREFDWVVHAGEVIAFDTTATAITGGPDGLPATVQNTTGGFVLVRNLVVEERGVIRVRGPNPMVVLAKGSVTIRGTIDASGFDAPVLPSSSTGPGAGGEGAAGGGAGGSGSPGAAARGGAGLAGLGAGAGAEGGESGFTPELTARRGGGGGGGRFARDQGPLVAQRGENGTGECTGAESGHSPPEGGAKGPEVFLDGDPANDFFGVQPVVDASGAVVARLRGELGRIHAGMGGGNGGDSIRSDAFPPPPGQQQILKGGGGGGGGGALVMRAFGPIVFGPTGRIRANGGRGARRGEGNHLSGACGGSGSGGHVILESAAAIDFTGENPLGQPQIWIEASGGPRVLQPPLSRGAGGAGGPGVVQLHVTHPERAPGDPLSNVILPLAALEDPDPLSAACQPRAHVLYPTVAGRSSARSRWIPLGAAGEGGGSAPESVVALRFEGVETAPGEDEGKVLTSGGRVLELAPLLGPAPLAQAGIELLPDGASLVLSGPVLAPLRASAQPISPDVYLRTPALLAGFTLRLANAGDPGRRADLTIAGARYEDATSRLTLAVGGLLGTLAEAVAELGGTDSLELTLVPRFFRVRLGPSGSDLLPDSHSARILFQGAADDGTGRADEVHPLVDWTADVTRFGALAPGTLDFVRFQVEFELDADDDGFDPEAEPLALEFLRFPLRY